MKWYYLTSIGYHFAQLLLHAVKTRNSDFVEMGLHHIITVYLIIGSYLINCWECGAVIAFIHDISDAVGYFAKFGG